MSKASTLEELLEMEPSPEYQAKCREAQRETTKMIEEYDKRTAEEVRDDKDHKYARRVRQWLIKQKCYAKVNAENTRLLTKTIAKGLEAQTEEGTAGDVAEAMHNEYIRPFMVSAQGITDQATKALQAVSSEASIFEEALHPVDWPKVSESWLGLNTESPLGRSVFDVPEMNLKPAKWVRKGPKSLRKLERTFDEFFKWQARSTIKQACEERVHNAERDVTQCDTNWLIIGIATTTAGMNAAVLGEGVSIWGRAALVAIPVLTCGLLWLWKARRLRKKLDNERKKLDATMSLEQTTRK